MKKAYIILYNGTEWQPKEVEILQEFKDVQGQNLYKVQYLFRNQKKKVTMSSKQIFFTYNSAKEYARNFSLNGV